MKANNSKASRHIARKVLIVIAILVLGGAGWGAWQTGLAGSLERAVTLPSCGAGTQFTYAPVDAGNIASITPLGNIETPDHTIPTDHMYINTIDPKALVAPGKIVVTEIEYNQNEVPGRQTVPDYEIRFTSCRGTDFYFGHVKALAGKLAPVMSKHGSCTVTHASSGETETYCKRPMNLTVAAGETIGTGPGQSRSMDFGLYKDGYRDPGLADPKYYFELTAACPLDYFNATTQAALFAKVTRTAEPRCGQVGQDKVGTVQGAWYASADPDQAKKDWNLELSLVHDNHQPQFGVIGIAGTITQPLKMAYRPATSGTTNLEPILTKTGVLYCYQSDDSIGSDQVAYSYQAGYRLLAKLNSSTSMQVEYQAGSCGGAMAFSKPTTYYR